MEVCRKDTKSLGNDKTPACESRDFVNKKKGVHFDTSIYSLKTVCEKNYYIKNAIIHHERWHLENYYQQIPLLI